MGRIWLVPVLLVTWVCAAEPVHACSCTPRSTTCGPPGEFWRASDVFTARVIKVDAGGAPTERRVEVIVTERWRGNVPARGSRVDVYTRSRSLCGYPFKTGREYLIYGSRTDAGRLATSLCSRTAPLERAAEDLHYANLATTGIVPAGRVIGDVRLRSNARRDRGVSNVRMTLRHQGKVTQTVTDEDGRYTLELTSAGRYELDVELPETQYSMQRHHVLDVPHAHACLERDIDVLFNGRIAGRVIDALGRGVGGLIVTHVPSPVRTRVTDRTSVLTRDDGSYEIARLPPGPFSVRMELPVDGPSDESQDSGNIVSEGVLGEGDRLALPTFSLLPSIAVIRLEGMIVGTDGWSMADARVFLRGESSERILGVPAVSDALGRFVLAIAEGERYQVFAERSAADSEFSDPVSITAKREMAPLRLVVRRRF